MLVTTIIPTMAAPERALTLKRAIASIRAASTQPISIMVVINGSRSDPLLCSWLATMNDVRVEHIPVASLPEAILHGRQLVATPYFSLLDDDDEYLPLGIDIRLKAMNSAQCPDIVVTNGYRCSAGHDNLTYDSLAGVSEAPLQALFRCTWLQSCNGLFRAASVGPEYFTDVHRYAEWTWLAFRLGLAQKKIETLDMPTYRCHDTPGSLSKSKAFSNAYFALFHRMLACNPPRCVRRLVRRRISAEWHGRSVEALADRQMRDAFLCHLRSLVLPGGSRYLSYTRHLLFGATTKRAANSR